MACSWRLISDKGFRSPPVRTVRERQESEMTAARQKGAGKPAENKGVKYKTAICRGVFCIQKQGQNMKNGYAIIMRRTKRIVGYAPTIEIARGALDAVAVPFRQNYKIIPYITEQVPANER